MLVEELQIFGTNYILKGLINYIVPRSARTLSENQVVHFTTYVKRTNGTWYLIDDLVPKCTKRVNKNESIQPVLMLYRKLHRNHELKCNTCNCFTCRLIMSKKQGTKELQS